MLSQVPEGQIMPYLEQILTPQLLALQEMTSQEPSVAAKPRLIFIFKLLTSLFQSLDISKDQEHTPPERARNQSQPLTVLYPQLMPYVKRISMKWTLDTDVMDAVWTFVKQVTCSVHILHERSRFCSCLCLNPTPCSKLMSFCCLGDDVSGRIRQAIHSRDSRTNYSML